MILQLILIFLTGVILDLLVTRYTRAVAEKKVGWATALSGFITITNFILLSVILSQSALSGVYNIIAYAGGNTVGTYIALRKS